MYIIHPLALLRKINAQNQQEMADKVGLQKFQIGLFERSKQIPDYYDCQKIGAAYGIEWHKIMEDCIKFREKKVEFIKSWAKISEQSDCSSVCISQFDEKRCTNEKH